MIRALGITALLLLAGCSGKPVCVSSVGEIDKVIDRLTPLTDQSNDWDVSKVNVTVLSTHEVEVELKGKSGSEWHGRGPTLHAAVDDLRGQNTDLFVALDSKPRP